MDELKKLPAVFYQTAAGKEPVREWLLGLDAHDRRIIGQDIATAEYGWPIGMPLCKFLGHGLWEVRSHLYSGRIARVIFSELKGQMVLLHAFVKKSQQISQRDIALARKRLKELLR